MIGGRKVVGSAQFRQGGALLQHGSILLEDNQGFVLQLTQGASLASTPSVPRPAWTDPTPPFRIGEVAAGITRAASARWSGDWDQDPDLEPVLEGAAEHYSHYRAPGWTWAR